jgi:hypothetical protein
VVIFTALFVADGSLSDTYADARMIFTFMWLNLRGVFFTPLSNHTDKVHITGVACRYVTLFFFRPCFLALSRTKRLLPIAY